MTMSSSDSASSGVLSLGETQTTNMFSDWCRKEIDVECSERFSTSAKRRLPSSGTSTTRMEKTASTATMATPAKGAKYLRQASQNGTRAAASAGVSHSIWRWIWLQ